MKCIKKTPCVYVFTGHFGSGKSEVAINFAINLKKNNPERKVAMVDLDIINPFFRSADAQSALEELGILVEVPSYANTNADVPALTGKMGAIIDDPEYDVILDIGGDDLGARAVGYYSDRIARRDHIIFFVVNKNRPFTKNKELACKIFDEVETSSLLKIDALVNNTNLLEMTNADTVLSGLPLMKEISDEKNIPLLFSAANKSICDELSKALPEDEILPLEEYVKLLWDRGG
ncbi:MAG: hypothetical protein IJZ90_02355 [Clostridia bacterium]|nr:hypothetical protein [Clostridia bacterium]